MAESKQDDYTDGSNRNSLRCIRRGENSSGGSQLKAWLNNNPSHGKGPTCDISKAKDGDFYDVEFDISGVTDP